MRLRVIVLMAALCMAGPLRAQSFQIGGDEQRETSIPLEVRPSLGVFVLGYVNGRGPYRFGLSLIQHTQLTSAVVMDAGLATRDKGIEPDASSHGFEQHLVLTDATLRLGDRDVSLDGASVFPDDDPAGYAPVPNYGGTIGVEAFRNGSVSLDLSDARLVLSPHTDTAPAAEAIELSLTQNATGVELDRLPAVTLSLNGQPGRFRLTFSSASLNFQPDSSLGRDLLDKSPHRIAVRAWTPNGIVKAESGTAAALEIGDHLKMGPIGISRNVDTSLTPVSASRRRMLLVRESPADGVVGLRVLGAFDITIDDLAGKMWLTRRGRNALFCRPAAHGSLRGTTGLTPWIYQGQGVVRAVTDGSPADVAGIEPGDRIVSIDGSDVATYYDHLDASCLAPAVVKVVFRNASGDHSVTLTPAVL